VVQRSVRGNDHVERQDAGVAPGGAHRGGDARVRRNRDAAVAAARAGRLRNGAGTARAVDQTAECRRDDRQSGLGAEAHEQVARAIDGVRHTFGIDPASFGVRAEAKLTEGRMLRFGTNEVVVGRAAARTYAGLTVGSEIKAGQNSWVVVGMFESRGSVAETEIWCDARFLQGAYRRGNSFQSVRARLESPQTYGQFKDWLTSNPQLNVSVHPEMEYYMAQSVTLTRLIRSVGFAIAVLMGIGAVFGAILTMYTAVSTRTREIATLRRREERLARFRSAAARTRSSARRATAAGTRSSTPG
jgi:hypothetical protein